MTAGAESRNALRWRLLYRELLNKDLSGVSLFLAVSYETALPDCEDGLGSPHLPRISDQDGDGCIRALEAK